MKKIGAYLLLFMFIISFTTVPLGIVITEENKTTQTSIFPYNHFKQGHFAATERIFPMQNRFQSYKQNAQPFPELLYISFGKGSVQNGFDIIEKNKAYARQLIMINQQYLEYQLDLPMFHMVDKLKLPDQVKGNISFS